MTKRARATGQCIGDKDCGEWTATATKRAIVMATRVAGKPW